MIKDKIRRVFVNNSIKKRVKFCSIMFVLVMVIAFAIFTVMKYEVEGEKEVPFKVGKVIVISSATASDIEEEKQAEEEPIEEEQQAEGQEVQGENENIKNVEASEIQAVEENSEDTNEGQENAEHESTEQGNTEQENVEAQNESTEQSAGEEKYIWNEKVIQTNDICIILDENKEYKHEQYIRSVKIENIKILENVKLGKIQVYMPNSLDDGLYRYTNDFLVGTALTYTGAASDNKKNLEIGNKGGCLFISFANVGVGEYKSNEDQEIVQGASILQKMNITDEELKFKVSFDLVIEVQDKTYKTNLVLDLPVEELVGQNEKGKEITDFDKLIYKRQ